MRMLASLASLASLAFVSALHAQSEPPSLREKIDALKSVNRSKATPEKLAAYDEGIKAVVTAKVVESAKKVGDVAPDFTEVSPESLK